MEKLKDGWLPSLAIVGNKVAGSRSMIAMKEVTIRLSSIIVPQEIKGRPSKVAKNNKMPPNIEGLARKLDALCKEISEISLALKQMKLGYIK